MFNNFKTITNLDESIQTTPELLAKTQDTLEFFGAQGYGLFEEETEEVRNFFTDKASLSSIPPIRHSSISEEDATQIISKSFYLGLFGTKQEVNEGPSSTNYTTYEEENDLEQRNKVFEVKEQKGEESEENAELDYLEEEAQEDEKKSIFEGENSYYAGPNSSNKSESKEISQQEIEESLEEDQNSNENLSENDDLNNAMIAFLSDGSSLYEEDYSRNDNLLDFLYLDLNQDDILDIDDSSLIEFGSGFLLTSRRLKERFNKQLQFFNTRSRN